ncbi:putative glycosyltransferase [Acorus gramineus]|uniref:Glycosyltransferase n=1 Tax=Acorus gramineus TaxID=55184 RepID=A0AAV9AWY0_ACOGR|nr:putative glycosyltransferase [Acorus gramineus]
MAGKPAVSLQKALLTLAVITLISLTVLIVRSLQNPQQRTLNEAPTDPLQREEKLGSLGGHSIYHSKEVFERSYGEMERRFKVFVYPDGDPNTYYQTPRKLTGKYASEGYFFQNIRESRFITDDPEEAHLFFVPISCHKMRGKNYVEGLTRKYPYWNRTLGADHFFVTCHDVGVRAFDGLPYLVKNSIRVVCSASYNVGYIPHKDVALPQVLQPFALPAGGNDVEKSTGLSESKIHVCEPRIHLGLLGSIQGGLYLEQPKWLSVKLSTSLKNGCFWGIDQTIFRTVLGFWAGHRNSKIRVILARVWENDTELAISNNRINRAIGELVYQKRFYRTKFCICPGGSQVNSARITDSIHYGCIPVILSDYYDLPFNDILNWKKFSLILKENDVYQLKSILKAVTDEQFIGLHKGVVEAQKHFEWHSPPVRYDAFHMVMYELWLRHRVIKY